MTWLFTDMSRTTQAIPVWAALVSLAGPRGEPLVVSGGWDGAVRVWTLAGGPWAGAEHDGQLGLLGWHIDSECWRTDASSLAALAGPGGEPLVVSGSHDGTVRVWALAGGPWAGARQRGRPGVLGRFTDPAGLRSRPVTSLVVMVGPDGNPLVVTSSLDGVVRAWTLAGECVNGLGDISAVWCLGTNSAYPTEIAMGFADGTLAGLRLLT